MALNMLLEQVKNAIQQHTDQQNAQPGLDPNALLQEVEGMFGTHQQNAQNSQQPQGMDPYGGVGSETGTFQHANRANQNTDDDASDQ